MRRGGSRVANGWGGCRHPPLRRDADRESVVLPGIRILLPCGWRVADPGDW
jgi:hypothetical protein